MPVLDVAYTPMQRVVGRVYQAGDYFNSTPWMHEDIFVGLTSKWYLDLQWHEEMALCDDLDVEIARQRQSLMLKQSRQDGNKDECTATALKEIKPMSRPTSTDGEDRASNDDNVEEESDEEEVSEMHLVLDSLLRLLEDLVESGKECDRLHEKAVQREADCASSAAVEVLADLTYEVFSSVARLALALERWLERPRRRFVESGSSPDKSATSLAATVRLLGTVRLPRINKLTAEARKHFPDSRDAEGLVLKKYQDKMMEDMRHMVRDAVRAEMETQQRQGWNIPGWTRK